MHIMIFAQLSNPPVINTIVDINSSTVRVTWTRPTMPNGIITTYTVTYNNSMSMTVPYNGENVSNILIIMLL